jgi:hypothetical protein
MTLQLFHPVQKSETSTKANVVIWSNIVGDISLRHLVLQDHTPAEDTNYNIGKKLIKHL